MSSSDLVSMFSTTIAGYHFLLGDTVFLCAIIPIKSYSNAEADKVHILSDNQNKSGIYMWKNLINKKKYVGSSENLRVRFMRYFNKNYLLRNTSMYICRSLLKHGYENFSLTILEYCEPEKCIEREKYYIDLSESEYNIVKDPTLPPMSGRTHSDITKTIISDAHKGKTLSDETKTKISDTAKKIDHSGRFKKGHQLSDETKKIISDAKKGQPKPEGAGSPSQISSNRSY